MKQLNAFNTRVTGAVAWSTSALLLAALGLNACGEEKTADGVAGGAADDTGGMDDTSTGMNDDTSGDDTTGAGGGGPSPNGAGGGKTGGAGNEGGASAGGTSAGGAVNTGGNGGEPPKPPARAECNGKPVPGLKVTLVKEGLTQPVFVTSAPNAASPLYVLEKGGALKSLNPANGDVATVTTLQVSAVSESGLLGMAFHPKFGEAGNKRVFLFYVSPATNSVVEEFTLDGGTLTAVPNTRMVDDPHPRGNHRGGMIAFGPDGYLYVAIGDGGEQNDGGGNAQDKSKPLGKILRIDVDNINTPPAGNLSGAGEDKRIYHWGFRNPWRFSFDSEAQDLYIADVGQGNWEEVTITKPGQPGSDYGWPALEGTHPCNACNTNKPPVSAAMLRPQVEYPHEPPALSSIVGGYVYRGSKIPDLVGNYFYADYDMKRVWTVKFDGDKTCENVELTETLDPDGALGGVSSFGQDADGEIYLASITKGAVFRIDPK